MVILIIAGIVLGVFIILLIAGVCISGMEKKNAPRKYQMAKEAYDNRNYVEALRLINDAFYVPLTENYKPDEAAFALQVIELLEDTMEAQGMKKGLLTFDLKNALVTASKHGGEVPEKLTEPVVKFLEKAAEGTVSSLDAIIGEVKKGSISVSDVEDNDPDFVHELTGDEDRELINKVGKLIMSNKTDEVIKFAGSELESAEGAKKAQLLDQRAIAFFLQKKYESALNDYLAIIEMFPDTYRIHASIAETYHKMGNRNEMQKHANIVLNNSTVQEYIDTVKELM